MIDFQGDAIDHRKRAKSLGQAAQINGRQSPHSHSCSCTDQRPAWYASIRTKTGWERELERGWEMTSVGVALRTQGPIRRGRRNGQARRRLCVSNSQQLLTRASATALHRWITRYGSLR